MNEKLKLLLKSIEKLLILQAEKNKNVGVRLDNLQKQIFNIVYQLHTLEHQNLTKSARIT